jgi:hypothetical protein
MIGFDSKFHKNSKPMIHCVLCNISTFYVNKRTLSYIFLKIHGKKLNILIKLYKMREAYKFIELINILILILGIFNYILLKLKIILIEYG